MLGIFSSSFRTAIRNDQTADWRTNPAENPSMTADRPAKTRTQRQVPQTRKNT